MNTPTNPYHCHTIEPSEPVRASVIWMHGLGASAHDFVGIIPYLQKKPSLEGVRYIFPQAPERAVTLNQGFVMPAWYDVYGLDRHVDQDVQGIAAAQKNIQAIIHDQVEQGIASEKIILMGYSQGGAMALYTGLHTPYPLAGIIGLSCYLPAAELLQQRLDQLSTQTPIWLAHGTDDAVLPFAFGEESAALLKALGCAVDFTAYPMDHEIIPQEVDAFATWMSVRLQGDR